MKLIAEISDKSLGVGLSEQFGQSYKLRKSARAVLFNSAGEVCIQYISKHGHHKPSGGGVEQDERLDDALRREVLEEVGYEIDNLQLLGMIIEYRNRDVGPDEGLIHISYGYIAHVAGGNGETAYEQGEIDDGMDPVWLPLDKAIESMEGENPDRYEGKFMLARDLAFLKEARDVLGK